MPGGSGSTLRVTCTPAQHWSGRAPFFSDACHSLWGGFVVEALGGGGGAVFFAGDTGYCGAFREVRSLLERVLT